MVIGVGLVGCIKDAMQPTFFWRGAGMIANDPLIALQDYSKVKVGFTTIAIVASAGFTLALD